MSTSKIDTPILYLYLLKDPKGGGYDTYSECVVVSSSAKNAKFIYPNEHVVWNVKNKEWEFKKGHENERPSMCYCISGSWSTPESILIKLLGKCSNKEYKDGDIVCSSYHAG